MSLTFLHTAEVHVNTFETLVTLVSETDASIQAKHHVNPQLLEDARELGADNPKVIEAVQREVAQLVDRGAGLVVCTCSTIGDIVESISPSAFHNSQNPIYFQRIDRAMADAAVKTDAGTECNKEGNKTNIVVVAALESTLEPTQALIESSALTLAREINLSLHHVSDAWQHFEANNNEAYWQSIANYLKNLPTDIDVIVLAQASMAKAVNYCDAIKTPILSSPLLGVQAALKTLKQI